MQLKLNHAGDTIVEVLIATAVIGSVLSAGYVITNFSLNTERQSQERNIALGILQGQIEQLRIAVPTNNQPFCMIDNSAQTVSGPTCDFNVSGTTAPASTQPTYHVSVTSIPNATDNSYLYTATAKWDALGGGVDNATLTYRLYGS